MKSAVTVQTPLATATPEPDIYTDAAGRASVGARFSHVEASVRALAIQYSFFYSAFEYRKCFQPAGSTWASIKPCPSTSSSISRKFRPNTGNVIRLCANTGATLHLVEPLGFDARRRKAQARGARLPRVGKGAGTRDTSSTVCSSVGRRATLWAFSTRGQRQFFDAQFAAGDVLLFGPETRGLPAAVLASLPPDQILRLPMRPTSRSLNLSNTVAIATYEAWRQIGFSGGQ